MLAVVVFVVSPSWYTSQCMCGDVYHVPSKRKYTHTCILKMHMFVYACVCVFRMILVTLANKCKQKDEGEVRLCLVLCVFFSECVCVSRTILNALLSSCYFCIAFQMRRWRQRRLRHAMKKNINLGFSFGHKTIRLCSFFPLQSRSPHPKPNFAHVFTLVNPYQKTIPRLF